MRWAWWVCALCIAMAAGTMAAGAREPTPARIAQATCADLSPVSDFNTFVEGDHRINNNDVYGRLAIGGDASFNVPPGGDVSMGNGLSRDPERLDLIVGGDINSPGNAQVDRGSAVHVGTLTGFVRAAGSVTQIAEDELPFSFSETFERLRSLQDTWADRPAQLDPVDAPGNALRFVGTSDRLNVFTVSASRLEGARTIQVGVPNGTATTLINVTGDYTSTAEPTVAVTFNVDNPVGDDFSRVGAGDMTSPKGIARGRLVWNFHDAEVVQIGSEEGAGNPSLDWEGSVLASRATVVLARTATVHGAVIAQRVDQTGRARLPGIGDACLPPPCQPPGPEPPGPEPEPPPLPPEPIVPSQPGESSPPAGGVAGEVAGSTRIRLCKRAKRRRVPAGGTLTYRLEVRNSGLAAARNVVVCDRVPVGLTIDRARGATVRGNRVCWRFRRVADERTMHLRVRVNETASGVIRNVARGRALNAPQARGRARVRVLGAVFDPCPPDAVVSRLAC